MSSRSISSAKIAGLPLKQRPRWSSPSVAKILPAILKQSSSPHCSFSVALGNDRQYERMEATFMSGPPQGSFHQRDTEGQRKGDSPLSQSGLSTLSTSCIGESYLIGKNLGSGLSLTNRSQVSGSPLVARSSPLFYT